MYHYLLLMSISKSIFKENLTYLALAVTALLGLTGFMYVSDDPSSLGEVEEPNVVFILLETTNAHQLPCYGYHRETTPAICEVAEDGVKFTNVYSQSGSTPKAVPTLFTTRTPREHQLHNFTQELSPELTTIFEAVNHRYNTTELYRDRRMWGSNIYQGIDYRAWEEQDVRSISYNESEPRFSFFFDVTPHAPYSPPAENRKWDDVNHSQRYIDEYFRSGLLENLSYEQQKNLHDGEILTADRNVEAIIDDLKEQGMYEESLVIIAADHGELFGEHGRRGHTGNPYKRMLHVPLIIKLPDNQFAGKTIDHEVRLKDLAPTILDIIGISQSRMDIHERSTSLVPLITGEEDEDVGDLDIYAVGDPEKAWTLKSEEYQYFLYNPEEGCHNRSVAREDILPLSETEEKIQYMERDRAVSYSERHEDSKNIEQREDFRNRLCSIYESGTVIPTTETVISEDIEERLRYMGYIE